MNRSELQRSLNECDRPKKRKANCYHCGNRFEALDQVGPLGLICPRCKKPAEFIPQQLRG